MVGWLCKGEKPKKQGAACPTIVYKQWPFYAPHNMLEAIVAAGADHLLKLEWKRCCFFFHVSLCMVRASRLKTFCPFELILGKVT